MTAALSIRNLRKTYDNKFEALKEISLDVAPGDYFPTRGVNGVDESATVDIISSLVRNSSAQVEILGKYIDAEFSAAKYFLGVVAEEFNCSMFEKVEDIVLKHAGYYG